MFKRIITLNLLLLATLLAAISIDLELPNLTQKEAGAAYKLWMEPGEPKIAFYPVRVLLPFGEKIVQQELSLSAGELIQSGVQLDYTREFHPISHAFVPQPVQPKAEIYQQDALFPAQDWQYLGTQYFRGHAIAVFNVFPFKYNPQRGELYFSPQVNIRIQSEFDAAEAQKQAKFTTLNSQTSTELSKMVLNPELQSSYSAYKSYKVPRQNKQINLDNPSQMLIITDAARAGYFDDYVSWKNQRGISTGLYIVEEIYASYDGADNAEKVRNFIIDAYSAFNETAQPLEYVIMGGDDEVVPERGVFGRVGDTRDRRMPSDLYYSNLDGDWNANGNTTYGEMDDEVDYIPEVHIGRFTAETAGEFANIFHKQKYYVDYNTFSNNRAIFYGENLNYNPLTWGGDYKDEVHQYLPDGYHFQTQYQRDGTYSGESVWNSINSGVNVMNHMGHANENSLMGQGSGSVGRLENTEYGFLYSQGCYPAAFDQRTSGDNESVGEHLLMQAGGVFAFIGNTRYGWYMPGSTDGPSQFYDRDFFRGLYEEGHLELGNALTFSRLENLNYAMQNDVMRWCYMEMILFGDPSIAVKLPDANLPSLSLESYHFDDSQGDGDGNINPGECIRFYPVIKNAEGMGIAQNVVLRVSELPAGVEAISDSLLLPILLPDECSPEDYYLDFQLSDDVGFGIFELSFELESQHPITLLSTGVQRYTAHFEITMFDNRFPWEHYHGGKSAPIIADFDADGDLEIMYVDVTGGLHFIDQTGEEFHSLQHGEMQNINRSSAMGNISSEDTMDLAFSSRNGNLYALTSSGELIFDYDSGSSFLFSPVIAKLSPQTGNAVISGALNGSLHAVDANGQELPGFPVQLPGSFQSELAVGDLDGDGNLEIICPMSAGKLFVVSATGQILPQFSKVLDSSLNGAPVILDNGNFAIASTRQLYLFDNQGNQLFQMNIDSAAAGGLTVADMDRNGELDIVFVSISGRLWVVNQAGECHAGFPVEIGCNFNCPPLVADIDGDEQYEILLHSYINSVFAYNNDGSILDGFPFGTTYNGATPGTLVDFDQNNQWKLITGFSHGILMSNLRRPPNALAPWTTYRGSLSRQGSFASTGYVSSEDPVQSPALFSLKQNYPNPFNPDTIISFELNKAGNVSLEIYNLRGQKVRSLHQGTLAKKEYEFSWDAKDELGNSCAAGVYLYRFTGKAGSQIVKAAYVK